MHYSIVQTISILGAQPRDKHKFVIVIDFVWIVIIYGF
jgi:hypothetical protein